METYLRWQCEIFWPLTIEVTTNAFNCWFKTNNLTHQSLKLDKVEIWPKKRSERSPQILLISFLIQTICQLNLWNWTKLNFWLSMTFNPLRKSRTTRSPWTLLIFGSRQTIWHLNLWNRTKLKIGPLYDLYLTFDPLRKGRTTRTLWTLLIFGSRWTIWHLNLWNRTKLKFDHCMTFIWPLTP